MFVEMGEVVNVVGLRGEVKLLVNGNFDEQIFRSSFLRRSGPEETSRPVLCESFRWKGKIVIAKLSGLDDRDAAEAAVGERLGFESADYDDPGFPRGEKLAPFVYHGLKVVTTDGREVGAVDDVLILPANWVLSVLCPAEGGGERELLIPVIDSIVREVDREQGRVVIDAMDGLLDDS